MFKGSWSAMDGHAAIAAGAPVFSEDGNSFTLDVLSTGTGDDYVFGSKTYTFQKDDKGNWFDADSGQQLRGFGRVDEQRMLDDQRKQQEEQQRNEGQPAPKGSSTERDTMGG